MLRLGKLSNWWWSWLQKPYLIWSAFVDVVRHIQLTVPEVARDS